MTIDEKLQHFYEISVEEAKEDAAKAIQEHKEHLAQMLEEHKSSRIQSAEAEVKAEAGHVRREVNKALSAEQLTLKRDWSQKQEELKTDLFAKVRKKLELFMAKTRWRSPFLRRIRTLPERCPARQAYPLPFLRNPFLAVSGLPSRIRIS